MDLNVCTPIPFDDSDILDYLDHTALPVEPTDEEGLDNESDDFAMNLDDKNRLSCMETMALALRMEIYIYLKRHAPFIYEEIEYHLQRGW